MKKYLGSIIFFGILLFGLLLRFYQLGNIPHSLNWDEVSWGYNGYAIVTTGYDEHGEFLPLSFKAFNDFKQPVYVYLNAITTGIFGLNAFAVRLPSALLGVISIVFVYLLVYELLRKHSYAQTVALITMALYAVSPWSIQFSRVAFEANVGLVLVIIGAFLFVRGINTDDKRYLFSSCIPFALSAYTYHSEKIIAPLLFAGFIVYFYQYFLNRKKLFIFLGLFFVLCNIFWLIDMRTTARGRSVVFTSNKTQILEESARKIQYELNRGNPYGTILHNRRLVYLNTYVNHYLSHFAPNFLFIKGDNARHHAPGMGVLYLWSMPFILLGIYFAVARKIRSMLLVFYWLLLAPVASSLAVDAPNASRSMIILPTWDIFAAVGIYHTVFSITKKSYKKVALGIISGLFLINFVYYIHQYFAHTNYEYGKYWQYGYREAVEYTKRFRGTDTKVFYLKDIEQPYIFYLFYNTYNPSEYLKDGGSRERLSQKCFSIDQSFFGDCEDKIKKGDILITSKTPIIPASLLHTIYYTNDQKEAIRIYEKE